MTKVRGLESKVEGIGIRPQLRSGGGWALPGEKSWWPLLSLGVIH